MKKIFCLFTFFISLSIFPQSQEEAEAKRVVTTFFEAFHKQDSAAMRNLVHTSVKMQSVGRNAEGKNALSTSNFSAFLNSITSIPAETKFEEKLHSFTIEVNGPLATVTTPYSFFVNGNLSHCGVNLFTMVKEAEAWKIVYIIDTRRKENCNFLQPSSKD